MPVKSEITVVGEDCSTLQESYDKKHA